MSEDQSCSLNERSPGEGTQFWALCGRLLGKTEHGIRRLLQRTQKGWFGQAVCIRACERQAVLGGSAQTPGTQAPAQNAQEAVRGRSLAHRGEVAGAWPL